MLSDLRSSLGHSGRVRRRKGSGWLRSWSGLFEQIFMKLTCTPFSETPAPWKEPKTVPNSATWSEELRSAGHRGCADLFYVSQGNPVWCNFRSPPALLPPTEIPWYCSLRLTVESCKHPSALASQKSKRWACSHRHWLQWAGGAPSLYDGVSLLCTPTCIFCKLSANQNMI